MDETLSIVVPTYRRPETLRTTLAALLALDYPPGQYEIIVVDDGDDSVTASVVREFQSGAVTVQFTAQANAGAAAARNSGARMASGDLLLLCDDDIVVEPDHLTKHVATRSQFGDVLVNGDWRFSPQTLATFRGTPFGRYRIELEGQFREQLHETPLDDDCVSPALLSACNLALRRELYWELGGFDEAFPYSGAEDQDFSLRARDAGCQLIRNRAIRLLHNDPTVTFRQYCTRQERGAQTAAVLARKFPERASELASFAENGPISRGDDSTLVLRKVAKGALARRVPLACLHALVTTLERARLRERALRRIYRGVIGLHIFRGYRRELRAARS